MPVYTIQPSFSGGELAPSLHARVDLVKYAVGLKTCRNFIVQAHGGVSNRSGTKFVCEIPGVSSQTDEIRLIPFEFNTEQTYVLVFSGLSMQVIKNGGQVLGGAIPVEITTPYLGEELAKLKFTQSADTMTICHPNHVPMELTRTSHTAWALDVIVFGTKMNPPVGLVGTATNYDGDLDSTDYSYVITSVNTDTGDESLQSTSVTITNNNLSATTVNEITWSAVSNAGSHNVYKKKGGVYGFVGRSIDTDFKDDNIKVDTSDTPPINDGSIFTDSPPSVVTYFQQRLTFAQSIDAPQKVWMSQTGNYHNFNVSEPLRDDDSITFTLAASQVNEIRHMVPLTDLIVLTSGGEWLMASSEGAVITPTSISVKPQGYRGASDVPPLVIGNTILYVQSKGSIIRDLAYTMESDSFTGNDLTVLSNHLFSGKQIKEWAYAQAPNSIVWAVLDDGSLAALTYMREHEVWGWSRHDTDGTFESVCTVSEGSEDATYFVVKRTIDGVTKRYIERLSSRVISDVKDAFFVDCGLTYDGTNVGDSWVLLNKRTTWKHTEDMDLFCNTSIGDLTFVIGDVGNTFVLKQGTDTLVLTVVAFISAGYVTVRAGRDVPESFRDVLATTKNWAKGVDTISGLGHLEGKTVSILADGNVEVQQVVNSGTITISSPSTKIHIGLPIQSDFQTLDLEVGNGTIQGKTKTVATVTLRVENSRGGKIGPSSDNLTEFKQRAFEKYGDPTDLKTGDIRIAIPSKWSSSGSIFFRQDDPLPVTLLAVIPEVSVGN
jgi:hypothetical protein